MAFLEKNIIICVNRRFLIVLFIIIIVLTRPKGSGGGDDEDEGIDESKVLGDIICKYEIDESKSQTPILGRDFIKPNNFDILVDDKRIPFYKDYKFPKTGSHKLRFVFYDKEVNIDNMFKGIKSLITVELSSLKNVSITSMISTFENCNNLQKFNIDGYDLTKIKSVQKLFYGAHNLVEAKLDLFADNNIEDMSYLFAMSDLTEIDLSKISTKNVKNCPICSMDVVLYILWI